MPRDFHITTEEGKESLIYARFPILFHKAMR